MKRLIQILDSFSYGDAIGNHTIAIYARIKSKGFECKIYADLIDQRLISYAEKFENYQEEPGDIILYHLSTGSRLNRKVADFHSKLIINYHNITPSIFFKPYNSVLADISASGYEDARFLADRADMVIADSDYNASELRKMGYSCPIYTVPIIMNFDDYRTAPDKTILNQFVRSNGITNIVFVGRIAPNKKQEDVILDFYYYTKYFNPDSRLILVGNYNNLESYFLKLRKYVRQLGLNNVIFTGHIKFSEILAYYKTADLLLCESEHEGFCVPLVEAMYFCVPIVAYASSAVGETLGNAGVLLNEKDPIKTAAIMDVLLSDQQLLSDYRLKEEKRLKYFESDKHISRICSLLSE